MARFLGMESLGPEHDHPDGYIPDDSPRWPHVRSTTEEIYHDARIAKLRPHLAGGKRSDTHELWAMPDGTVVRHSVGAHKALLAKTLETRKPGTRWRFIGPDVHDAPAVELRPGEREHLEHELEWKAHEIRPGEYLTGRRIWVEGEGIIRERTNDAGMVVASDKRTDLTKLDLTAPKKERDPYGG